MKEEEYIELDFKDIITIPPLSRRELLKRLGGGIIILFIVGDLLELQAQQRGRRGYPEDFNAYLRIGDNGRISCFTGKIEMGQGIITSLAQMLADELEVKLDSVDMVMGDTDQCPWDMGTFGSMTTRFFGPALRAAAAEAKVVLTELAAEDLKVPKDRLIAKEGIVYDRTDVKKKVTYGQLAKDRIIARHARTDVKTASEFNIIGESYLRTDSLEKVTGKAKYAGDILLPGMLYARILRPPAHGAKIKSVDTSEAEKINGIQVIKEGNLIAVLHKYPDVAQDALSQIEAEFERPESTINDKTIFKHLQKVGTEKEVVEKGGNLQSGKKNASVLFEKIYLNSYVAHAPIETHTALAKIEGDKTTVWASTQTPFRLKDQIAEELNISPENVRVITPFVGGGFGGKSRNTQAIEAVKLAQLTGKAVQVAWTREEEFFYDTFRPAAVVAIKSGITNLGKISFWDYSVYYAGQRGSHHIYDIQHHRTTSIGGGWEAGVRPHPFGTGAWRAPANNTNTFARESHIDIMASKAGMDPLDFRLKNLTDKRMILTLKAAAEKFGWTASKSPRNRGFGIACGIDSGTYVAIIADVEVNKTSGHVQVKRVVCAQDMGLVINPEGAKLQMEGCITMGLGYALTEEIHFNGGEIFNLNFYTYKLPTFSWVPKIETVLVKTEEASPQGGGEPAIICIGGVIANAIFDATGVRVFQLPMTPERVKEALAKKT
jgi:isoquinoline 1-oxidoreductase